MTAIQRLLVSVTLCALTGATCFAVGRLTGPPTPPAPANPVMVLAARAAAAGLYVHSGAGSSALITHVCYLSDHPLTATDLLPLRLAHAGDSTWKGIAWVCASDTTISRLDPGSVPGCRRWGRLVVTGDPEFLDRLEALMEDCWP